MRASFAAWAASALALTNCSTPPGLPALVPDAAPPPPPLELDVYLRAGGASLTVVTNQPDTRQICTSGGVWAAHPECYLTSDVADCRDGSPLPPDVCVVRASLVKAGAEVAMFTGPLVGGFSLSSATGADTLVLAGCGKEARIVLPLAQVDPPEIVALGVDADALSIDWASTEPVARLTASLGNGFGGPSCPVGTVSPARMPRPEAGLDRQSVGLSAIFSRGETTTAFGPLRLWMGGWRSSARLTVPVREQDHWVLRGFSSAQLDLGFPPRDVYGTQLHFEIDPGGTRIIGLSGTLSLLGPPTSGPVRYQVTPSGATLEVQLETGLYRGTLLPVTPSDPLVLGGPHDETFAFTTGPISMVNVASGRTMQMELSLTASFGAVPRPL